MTDAASGDDAASLSLRNVAHELRTPLTSVLGVLALMDDGSVSLDAREAAELVALARGEAEQMLFLVDSLLTISRLEQGTLDPARASFDLADTVRAVLNSVPGVAARTLVQLEGHAVALADRRLVAQILTNLFQNIDRYAPEGQVEVHFEDRGDQIAVLIADDGPGIPADQVNDVFGGSRSEHGLGVGMRLSREIAHSLGGDLVVSDHPIRAGATFALTLPRGDADAVDAPDPLQRPHTAATLPPSARLLVDITTALTDRSFERLVSSISGLLDGLLGADAARLVLRDRSGDLQEVGALGDDERRPVPESAALDRVLASGAAVFVPRLADDEPSWVDRLGSGQALFVPVPGPDGPIGALAISWVRAAPPSERAVEIAMAIGALAGLGADRAQLAVDVDFERGIRSIVMEALPIAISIFAGDPPEVIDWNDSERRLLGITSDGERPSNLAMSQEKFRVQFLDGTPLDLNNSPVTRAIRSRETSGPFYLRVTRPDGSTAVTRTYCAPFFDATGKVAGAVVSSEEIDEREALELSPDESE